MNAMATSPPLTPTKKRKADLDLGNSTLGRPSKSQRSYYGIPIHRLLEDAQAEERTLEAAHDLPTPPAEPQQEIKNNTQRSLLWTEKYRARKFTELIGDERTHREVMHWLKRWDSIVYPSSQRYKSGSHATAEEKPHRKILMLTGPPGLGKTTLAHVCARQAGYEPHEINASDERSAAVVNGRIRDMVGTENVKNISTKPAKDQTHRRAGGPVCVIIDEVDGVVTGNSGSGGEGGFIKALVDLVLLDQRNSNALSTLPQGPARKKKRDRFRLLRPVILVCNDVYHPALRPLRTSSMADIVHVRKPAVQDLALRLQRIFEKEGVPCDSDGVRRLCEATWGVSNRKEGRSGNGSGEGDMRGILVVGEWVAGRLRATQKDNPRLTRKWVEENIVSDLAHGGGAARGLGRGGPKDIVERVFQVDAGFPRSTFTHQAQEDSMPPACRDREPKGVAEGIRRSATERLRGLIEAHGETDRTMTDCFSMYPEKSFQDDTLLSKPNSAYKWLHFHDRLAGAVYSSNEWELAPYLSAPILAFHHLFSTATRQQYATPSEDVTNVDVHPFSGPSASWAAHEAEKQNKAHILTLQSSLSLPLTRLFTSSRDISTELQPYLLRMLSPNVNPVVVGGREKGIASVRRSSEQALIKRSVNAMAASGVRFDRIKVVSDGQHQWVYRMEPPLDVLETFASSTSPAQTRYAVRQVLEQEWHKEELRNTEFRSAGTRISTSRPDQQEETDQRSEEVTSAKRSCDFFGRPIEVVKPHNNVAGNISSAPTRVWVTYHEGFSNAVRKPVTMDEFLRGM